MKDDTDYEALRRTVSAEVAAVRESHIRMAKLAPELAAFVNLVVGNAHDLNEYGEEELRQRLRGLAQQGRALLARLA